MSRQSTVLQGGKAIADFTGRSWNTVKMWINNKNFPARIIDGRWESDTELVIRWRRQQIVKGGDDDNK